MNKLSEKIKDLIYDSMDFILIIMIVVAVGATIMWRIDLLFNTDSDIVIAKETTVTENTDVSNKGTDTKDENDILDDEVPTKENNNITDDETEDTKGSNTDNDKSNEDKKDTDSNDSKDTTEVVNISIPEGTSAFKIADILVDKGLVDNKWNFLTKATELQLDTKLKPGEFEIKRNSSLETMVKILAKEI